MSKDTEDFADNVARQLILFKPQERVEFFDTLTSIFCRHCGDDKEAGDTCHCENDE